MKRSSRLFSLLLLAASFAFAQHAAFDPVALNADPATATDPIAPVLDGIGSAHLAITTQSPEAQRFFDQGLRLTYAFNHQEALRSFKEAARLDPDCAMAYWGWALVLGPNLNLPMVPDVAPQAYKAIQKAVSLKGPTTDKEQRLIDALAQRYAADPAADRAPLDEAYADAMHELQHAYEDDNNIAVFFAAALMNLTPWDYWSKDGAPHDWTPEILSLLEGAAERDPKHEGALHYYIHAIEAVHPERAEPMADLLTGLTPNAGHLAHMPSHIYMQTGRYADAFTANTNAIKADEGYVTACRAQGIYPLAYYPHNIHFLAWAAIMQGRRAEAMAAARKVAGRVPMHHVDSDIWALYQTFLSMPLYTMVRFGMWKEILAEPALDREAHFTEGIRRYARGLAYTHTGDLSKAGRELKAMDRIIDDPAAIETLIGYSNAKQLLQIARGVLNGELLAKRRKFDEAVAELDRVVRLEDALLYNEPPDWYYPTRHTLGAILLDAGRADEAEIVFWQDLKENRENGYSLKGVIDAMKAQGKDPAAIEKRFEKAWSAADVQLASARF
jgi:tetratricopeptide (TPR) repeat protein